ncbi:hypothetical protein N657DRAFT_639348 [Parathielavia appendiculata]|uniref:Uncharacterized protein n=1 Tax=Parathielavia appendiculata TaxID=2587402 RepID=A0AAN6Z8G5_9PEZI|nr:hypothetical protein N657DRAFT_639348 [Parathielavia appendiculata]
MKSETEIRVPGTSQGKRQQHCSIDDQITNVFRFYLPTVEFAVVYRQVSMTTLPHPFVNPNGAFSI